MSRVMDSESDDGRDELIDDLDEKSEKMNE